MNKKEIAELRRQFTSTRTTINEIFGCYVNDQKKIIAKFQQSTGMLGENELDQYLKLLKKSFSGKEDKNLHNIQFTAADFSGAEHQLLMQLRDSKCKDEQARDVLFHHVIDAMELNGNFLILLACSDYDVPRKKKDNLYDKEPGDTVFRFITCAVCKVVPTKSGLGFYQPEQTFRNLDGELLASSPVLGFCFPAFDDRTTNLYNALYYTKSADEIFDDFVETVFGKVPPRTLLEQRSAFAAALDKMGNECNLQLICELSAELRAKQDAYQEMGRRDPLIMTEADYLDILNYLDVSKEGRDAFAEEFRKNFGDNAAVRPEVLLDLDNGELASQYFVIKTSPETSDTLKTTVIDGVKYVLVRADDNISYNGVDVHI